MSYYNLEKQTPANSCFFWGGGREGGGPKEAVPDPPPCGPGKEKGIIRSATISKLHCIFLLKPMVSHFALESSGVGFTTCCISPAGSAARRGMPGVQARFSFLRSVIPVP